jgi:hypothetical protein
VGTDYDENVLLADLNVAMFSLGHPCWQVHRGQGLLGHLHV